MLQQAFGKTYFWYDVCMDIKTPSLEQRIAFWSSAVGNIGKLDGRKSATSERQSLLDAIDFGMMDRDVVEAAGHELLSMALSMWPTQDNAYEDGGFSDLTTYKPGAQWSTTTPVFTQEVIVASLLAAGADPWAQTMQTNKNGALETPDGKVFPPILLAFLHNDVPRSSVFAFLDHPQCPPPETLDLYRDQEGYSLLQLAADKDVHVLKKMLAKGMNPNAPGKGGLPPIFGARLSSPVRALIEGGADTTLLDKAGNSLSMHWALHASYCAKTLSALLPKRNQEEALSVNSLTKSLLSNNKSTISTILSRVGDVTKKSWKAGDVDLNVMDIASSIAAYHETKAVIPLISEIALKKYPWGRVEKNTLSFVVDYLWRARGISSDVVNARKKLKFDSNELSPEDVCEVIDRMVEVRRCAFSSHTNKDIESNRQSEILFGWLGAFETIHEKGESWEPALISCFRGFKQAMHEARNIAPLFSDQAFTIMLPYFEKHGANHEDWAFWTGVGILHGSIDANNLGRWRDTRPPEFTEWLSEPVIERALNFRSRIDPQVRADIENAFLQKDTTHVEQVARPTRRI